MQKTENATNLLVLLAAFVVVVAGMKAAASLVVPFFLSIFIAIVSAPGIFWLQSKRVPMPIAIVIGLFVLIGAILAIATLLGSSINDFIDQIPIYRERFFGQINQLAVWLSQFGIQIDTSQLSSYVDPDQALRLVGTTFTNLSGMLSQSFFIILTTIFILVEASSFPVKLKAILEKEESMTNFNDFVITIKNYMALKTITSFATGLIITIILLFIGVEYALLWGLLAFLLNFIPTIGSIIAAVPAVILAFVQVDLTWIDVIFTLITYIAVNVTIGSIIEPRFLGRELGLSALVVFTSLIFWGWVLGPIGMLLSVPLTMTLKIALNANENTKWIATILGPEKPAKAAVMAQALEQEQQSESS